MSVFTLISPPFCVVTCAALTVAFEAWVPLRVGVPLRRGASARRSSPRREASGRRGRLRPGLSHLGEPRSTSRNLGHEPTTSRNRLALPLPPRPAPADPRHLPWAVGQGARSPRGL